MLRAFFLSLGDLTDGRVLRILLQALGVTALLFVATGLLLGWLLNGSDPCSLVDTSCPIGAGGGGVGAVLLTLVAALLLFPSIAVGVVTGFADRVCEAVERRHYPAAAAESRRLGKGQAGLMGLRSAARLLLYNLLAIPFYLLLLATGIGPLVLFVIVNGVALGRDLAELAAARHGDAAQRWQWLRATRGEQAQMGVLVAALFLVPVVNLVAPVIGAAMAIHLFNRRREPLFP